MERSQILLVDIFFKRLREKSLGYSISKNSRINGCCFQILFLIRVFLHEFISALKTEPKSMVFEKYAKNGKKKYFLSLFSIF